MAEDPKRTDWEQRHASNEAGDAEPSLMESMPLLPLGRVLDIAAGNGRNSIALAQRGFHVIAVDWSANAMNSLYHLARTQALDIAPLIVDLEKSFPFKPASFDTVVNVSYLERSLLPMLKQALRPGGMLLVDTFLIDQAAIGHPRNPRFLLGHYELRELLSDMELIRYREGIVNYGNKQAWRAAALALNRK